MKRKMVSVMAALLCGAAMAADVAFTLVDGAGNGTVEVDPSVGTNLDVFVKIDAGANKIAGIDVQISCPSAFDVPKISDTSAALQNASVERNLNYLLANLISLDGDEPVSAANGAAALQFKLSVPAGTSVGTNYVGLSRCLVYKNGTSFNYTTAITPLAIVVGTPPPPFHTVTVEGGSTTNVSAAEGSVVTVTASDPKPGEAFVQWAYCDGVDFADASASETSFLMPTNDVTVKAVFLPIVVDGIDPQGYPWTGKAVEPKVVVSLDGVDLLTANQYEISCSNNMNAGTATMTVTMLPPLVGSQIVTFKITPVRVGGGTEEPGGGEVPAGGESKFDVAATYDGKGLAIDTNALATAFGVLAGGADFAFAYAVDDGGAPAAAWTVDPPAFTNAGEYVAWYKATNQNYEDFVHAAKITITQRAVTLTSGSAEKMYDGTALTNHVVTVGGDGFIDGEGAAYDVTGLQTHVGTSENTFTYALNGGTDAANYEIVTSNGTLTVTKAANAWTADPFTWPRSRSRVRRTTRG